jgi:predicted ArsR family transcriptional regulator
MTHAPIPPDIRRFIVGNITSVPQLEALLLLRQHEGTTWSSEQLAARLYISEPAARDLLASLLAAGFVSIEAGESAAYRFTPKEDLREVARRMDEFYSRNLVAVTQLIHSASARSAQQFADAFKLRKEQ